MMDVNYYIRYLLTELMKRKDKDGKIDEAMSDRFVLEREDRIWHPCEISSAVKAVSREPSRLQRP